MTRTLARIFAAALACTALAAPAFAHAFLNHAVPGVGMTVHGSPPELKLRFTENIVPAFSGMHVAKRSGAAVAIGKPGFGPADTMHARLVHVLTPGTYVVSWHVVSVDTHRTHGTYEFTIAP